MHVVALLPWWAGVALAAVAYLLLHGLAARPVQVTMQPGQMGSTLTHAMWRAVTVAGQYVFPLLCIAGAGISAWKRKQRKALIGDVAASKASDALDGMSWREFEVLVGEGFRLQGYQVAETGGGGADGGIDLVLRQGGEKFLVQCKQWRAYRVGVDVVRELYGVMAARGAAGGFVVTSGRFTPKATAFAAGRNVKLLDGPKLRELIERGMRKPGAVEAQPRARATTHNAAESSVRPSAIPAPGCPLCAKQMTRRSAKRGANAGNVFWGCTAYPSCRGTRAVEVV